MLLAIQTAGKANYSVLDPQTIMRNWVYEGVTAKSRIGDQGRSITNVDKTTALMCCATGKPRKGKYMLRVKFTGSGTYYCAIVPLSAYSLAGRITYRDTLPLNVWHTIRVDTGSDDVRRVYVNDVLLTANASMIDIGFYVFNNIDRFEIDAGQLGSALLAGYEWL